MKYKILRLVFRNKTPADSNDVVPTQRQRSNDPQPAETLEVRHIEHKTVGTSTQQEEQLVEAPKRIPQMTTQDLNNLYPGAIELVYDCPIKQDRPKRVFVSKVIAPNGTSFLHLPRELRDEIYRYAVTCDRVWRIRPCSNPKESANLKGFREQLPGLCRASIFCAQEVLTAHYRHNVFRYSAVNDHNPNTLLDWIQQRSSELVKSIRHMHITHQVIAGGGHSLTQHDITTSIEQRLNGTIEVSAAQQPTVDLCHCGIAELVQERLLREDAQINADCVRRIQKSTEMGPVLGFALQLLEAVQLAQACEETIRHLPAQKRSGYDQSPLPNCISCGQRKWLLRH